MFLASPNYCHYVIDMTIVANPLTCIAWDFDGVLNRNIVDGRFVWADQFETDFNQSLEVFTQTIFGNDFDAVITGREDLCDRVQAWIETVGADHTPNAVLDYWFSRDALPDPEVLKLMDAAAAKGLRQVILTNNEARGSQYIEDQMGFSARVERLFSSGRIGLRKPEPAIFLHVTDSLGLAPGEMMLVDDLERNVEAARAKGWQGFWFTDATRDGLAATIGL